MSGGVSAGKDLNREVKMPQPAETNVSRPSRVASEAADVKEIGMSKEEADFKAGPTSRSLEEVFFKPNDLTLLTEMQQTRITSLDGLPE